jgi:hypothetical protein
MAMWHQPMGISGSENISISIWHGVAYQSAWRIEMAKMAKMAMIMAKMKMVSMNMKYGRNNVKISAYGEERKPI